MKTAMETVILEPSDKAEVTLSAPGQSGSYKIVVPRETEPGLLEDLAGLFTDLQHEIKGHVERGDKIAASRSAIRLSV